VVHPQVGHFFKKSYGGGPALLRYTALPTAMPGVYDSEAQFVGEFKNGRPHNGRGRARDGMNGFWFDGELRNGFLHNGSGHGMLASGCYYQGSVIEGLPDNQGRLVFPDGSVVQGNFHKGKLNGPGVTVDPRGRRELSGCWENGELCGI